MNRPLEKSLRQELASTGSPAKARARARRRARRQAVRRKAAARQIRQRHEAPAGTPISGREIVSVPDRPDAPEGRAAAARWNVNLRKRSWWASSPRDALGYAQPSDVVFHEEKIGNRLRYGDRMHETEEPHAEYTTSGTWRTERKTPLRQWIVHAIAAAAPQRGRSTLRRRPSCSPPQRLRPETANAPSPDEKSRTSSAARCAKARKAEQCNAARAPSHNLC